METKKKRVPIWAIVIITIVVMGILLGRAVIYLLSMEVEHLNSVVENQLRIAIGGLENYYTDYQVYPPGGIVTIEDEPALAEYGKTELMVVPPTLTTPIAYLTSLPFDFHVRAIQRFTFAYAQQDDAWILFSPGWDKKYDIDPKTDVDWESGKPTPFLLNHTYDPTNGMVSGGDVWRMKE